jgi:putative transposase
MNFTYKYRIYPNKQQSSELNMMLGAFCDLYNAGLNQRIDAYNRKGKSLSCIDQCNELKAVRLADERLAKHSFSAEQQVLRRLDKSFRAFFGRLKKGKAGFPRYQKKSSYDSADFRVGDGLTIKNNKIALLGITDRIKVKWHRLLPVKPKAAVIKRKANKWYACFQIELPDINKIQSFNPIGIDVGLKSLCVLSDGTSFDHPRFFSKAQKRLRVLQRALARCKRESKRRTKRKLLLIKCHERIFNQRRNFAHKLTTTLIKTYDGFAIENLQIKNLMKSNLAKSIQDAAWNQITSFIGYKAASAGFRCIKVDPKNTTQTCSVCGSIPEVRLTLADRIYNCEDCGHSEDRDVNAAKNILIKSGLGISPQALIKGISPRIACEAVCL